MKCKVIRHHLLTSESPARPPAAVAGHLAHCPACREWQRELVRMERLVPKLPVPQSCGKLDCVREVLHGEAYGRNGKVEVGWQRRERALRKVAITFALAAGLLFVALIWYAWQHQNGGADLERPRRNSEYTLEHIARRFGDPGATTAPTARERVERLATLASRLHDEVKERAATGTFHEVTVLAQQFEVLVQDGILRQARSVPTEEREKLLSAIADQLARAESEANRLATQHSLVEQPLHNMAKVAANGHLELQKLAENKA